MSWTHPCRAHGHSAFSLAHTQGWVLWRADFKVSSLEHAAHVWTRVRSAHPSRWAEQPQQNSGHADVRRRPRVGVGAHRHSHQLHDLYYSLCGWSCELLRSEKANGRQAVYRLLAHGPCGTSLRPCNSSGRSHSTNLAVKTALHWSARGTIHLWCVLSGCQGLLALSSHRRAVAQDQCDAMLLVWHSLIACFLGLT